MAQLEFDFQEFITAPRENPDFIQPFPWPFVASPVHDKAINTPRTASLYSVIGNRIELNKERFPTKRGWKTLNNLLSVYRDKRFETVRYLLVDRWGIIRDHAAITSYSPNRCRIVPDDFAGTDFIGQVKEQAENSKCKIVVIHNHPSGEVEASDEDISITGTFQKAFGDLFAGHVIWITECSVCASPPENLKLSDLTIKTPARWSSLTARHISGYFLICLMMKKFRC